MKSKQLEGDLVNIFESICGSDGTLSKEECLSFLNRAQCDSEKKNAFVAELSDDLTCHDFVSICQKTEFGIDDIKRYEGKKKLKTAIVRLRRLSTVDVLQTKY